MKYTLQKYFYITIVIRISKFFCQFEGSFNEYSGSKKCKNYHTDASKHASAIIKKFHYDQIVQIKTLVKNFAIIPGPKQQFSQCQICIL